MHRLTLFIIIISVLVGSSICYASQPIAAPSGGSISNASASSNAANQPPSMVGMLAVMSGLIGLLGFIRRQTLSSTHSSRLF